MHDELIVKLLNQRDEKVLQTIKEQYGALCYQIAYRMTGNHQEAEECVNDMLLDVWNSIPPNCPNHLPAYLAALVRRTAINKYEKAHRLKRGGTQFSTALDEISEIIPAKEQVESEIEQREMTAALTAWLQTLPPESKRIFLQRYYMSDSVKAIAQKYDMSIGAVKMKLMRLRQQLKDYLEKEGLL
ncbi:sigma-70 family RNA polymerase sigma factor [uncultured Ruminococcus sp.]|uniref:RNA polymerase sigma factor n=1 Tax=uncultured Ruminococcus sp. TaxID=165186 RepID=UPI0025E2BE8D|nr:sigma-70 family RNA polymerase sigma factor [uncultured Ruminococcus sp.]